MTQIQLVDDSEGDSEGLHDCERHGPDHIMAALERVSRESGVPVEDFCYSYDRTGGPMAELNRRAYALAALAAGVRVLPEFQVAGVPCLVYGATKRKIAQSTARTLWTVFQSVRNLGEATHQEVARYSGLPVSVVKTRMKRLYDAALVRDVSQRDSGVAMIWTGTKLGFNDVFEVRDASPIRSIAPATEHAEAA